jgi:hypothetical protein
MWLTRRTFLPSCDTTLRERVVKREKREMIAEKLGRKVFFFPASTIAIDGNEL